MLRLDAERVRGLLILVPPNVARLPMAGEHTRDQVEAFLFDVAVYGTLHDDDRVPPFGAALGFLIAAAGLPQHATLELYAGSTSGVARNALQMPLAELVALLAMFPDDAEERVRVGGPRLVVDSARALASMGNDANLVDGILESGRRAFCDMAADALTANDENLHDARGSDPDDVLDMAFHLWQATNVFISYTDVVAPMSPSERQEWLDGRPVVLDGPPDG